MNPQEKQEIKKAICQALDGQPPMRIDRIATRSGVDGKALTDALFELENVGMITSTLNDGRPIYRLKSGRPIPVKKPAGKSEKEMRENVLRYFKGRPGQDVSTRSINAMLGSHQAGTSVLNKLKEEGLIERSGHGIWRLVGGQDEEKPTEQQPEKRMDAAMTAIINTFKPQAGQEQAKDSDAAVLATANTDEKPGDEHDITIGCFSDGSFSLDKGNGLWKMRLSRAQMMKVMGFVEKFIAMEGV